MIARNGRGMVLSSSSSRNHRAWAISPLMSSALVLSQRSVSKSGISAQNLVLNRLDRNERALALLRSISSLGFQLSKFLLDYSPEQIASPRRLRPVVGQNAIEQDHFRGRMLEFGILGIERGLGGIDKQAEHDRGEQRDYAHVSRG